MKHVLKKLGVGKDQILNKENLLGLKGGTGGGGYTLEFILANCSASEEICLAAVAQCCTQLCDGTYTCDTGCNFQP